VFLSQTTSLPIANKSVRKKGAERKTRRLQHANHKENYTNIKVDVEFRRIVWYPPHSGPGGIECSDRNLATIEKVVRHPVLLCHHE